MRAALLGPQRFEPALDAWLDRLDVAGPVAVITAGWQERERDTEDLELAIDRELVALDLWHRAEAVREADPSWARTDAEGREREATIRRLYRRRLDHEIAAAREMLVARGEADLVLPERHSAVESVRALDAHYRARTEAEAEERLGRIEAHDGWRSQRTEIRAALEPCDAVLIAGGHVGEILEHLRRFDLAAPLAERALAAWSAGAMALTETAVGFHDRPPQGAGNAEVLAAGLGLVPGLVVLPDARRRLTLDDPHRVALMARRFDPSICVTLDRGAGLVRGNEGWLVEGARTLSPDGAVNEIDVIADARAEAP